MPTKPNAQNEPPGKIEVEFPPNIATDESVRTDIEKGLADQTKAITKALNLKELPGMFKDAFKEILVSIFRDGFDASIIEALDKTMDKAMSKQLAKYRAAADSLYFKAKSVIEGQW